MAGSVNGTTALISAQYHYAFFFHCASHNLNLAFVKYIAVTNIHNMMCTVDRIHYFFLLIPSNKML